MDACRGKCRGRVCRLASNETPVTEMSWPCSEGILCLRSYLASALRAAFSHVPSFHRPETACRIEHLDFLHNWNMQNERVYPLLAYPDG